MPELPDVAIYLEALARHVHGQRLERLRLANAFVLRSVRPRPGVLEGRRVAGSRRLGKRIVLDFGDELFLVIHLMIAGRLRWRGRGAKVGGRSTLAALDFERGTLLFTEAGSRKRASLYVVQGETGLARHDPGGLEVLATDLGTFRQRLALRNHTVKRALTDPRLFSGIGNAYSDEILHRARMSPFKQTRDLDDEESSRLYDAIRAILTEWTDRTRREVGEGFPEKVTAFREGMAVHGRHRQPCPVCSHTVQRIVYAANEANYCSHCQTGGKLLADRALSRLLKKDWPKTIYELEES